MSWDSIDWVDVIFKADWGQMGWTGLDAKMCKVDWISCLIVDVDLMRRDAVYISYRHLPLPLISRCDDVSRFRHA